MNGLLRKWLHQWWLPVGLALLAVVAQLWGGAEMWRYQRDLVVTQPWRLITAHWVHLGAMHLALNLLGLMLIWALFGQRLRPWAWGLAVLICSIAVSVALYLNDTGLTWYVGLSGVLHGLFALGALALVEQNRTEAVLLIGGLLAKVLWEQVAGDTATASLVGGAVIVNAHFYGTLAGLACAPLVCGDHWRRRC